MDISLDEMATVPAEGRTSDQKIALAMTAGPPHVAANATIAELDGKGGLTIIRPGANAFTCRPGNRKFEQPPMCSDKAAMQWHRDFRERKPAPTNATPGIDYMLAGAKQRSDTDPCDSTSPEFDIPPHWMILWPFDPKTTGLPATHRDDRASSGEIAAQTMLGSPRTAASWPNCPLRTTSEPPGFVSGSRLPSPGSPTPHRRPSAATTTIAATAGVPAAAFSGGPAATQPSDPPDASGAVVREIPDAGHLASQESPAAVCAAVTAHVAAVGT